MKALVIAEKPSVAKDMAKVLGQFKNGSGFLENDKYIVTWAIGHLVELCEPDEYDPRFKTWQLASLPIIPQEFKLKPYKSTIKQFKIIKELMHRRDVEQIINACDAGREGELIFRYIYQQVQGRKPFQRLWISSLTDEAIQEGFKQLRAGNEYDLLAEAARCRSESDWLVGINATRAYTKKCNTLLSIGRVQTPTLAILVNREKEIEEFVPEPYWQVAATFTAEAGKYQGLWFKGKEERLNTEEAAKQIVQAVEKQPGTVEKVETKQQNQQPPLLFDLTELQREMNRKYGFSASKTLKIAQSLYEEVKLITYPRTDSRYISKDMVKTLPGILRKVGVGPYGEFVQHIMAQKNLPLNSKVVNNKKVSDHHAIIPTAKTPNLTSLSPDQQKVYDAVLRRFLANFYPETLVEHTTVVTVVRNHKFKTKVKVIKKPGWREVYGNQGEEDEALDFPPLVTGMPVQTSKVELLTKETKPPNRYTEATLLSAMETAGKLVDDEDLREAMKDGGLGTPATRAGIIERLIKVGYVERVKKNLVPTEKGRKLIEAISVQALVSPEMTGDWESKLMQIQKGEFSRERFMKEIKGFIAEVVEQVKRMPFVAMPPDEKKDKRKSSGVKKEKAKNDLALGEPVGQCPLCGTEVIVGHRGYGCAAFQKGCKLVIPKEISSKKLTLNQVNTLLTKGKTGVIKGFKNASGQKFDAKLVLSEKGISFER